MTEVTSVQMAKLSPMTAPRVTALAHRSVPPISIVGIGNVLLGDDGFGPFAVDLSPYLYDTAIPESRVLCVGISISVQNRCVVAVDTIARLPAERSVDCRRRSAPVERSLWWSARLTPGDGVTIQAAALQ
jgi:hypothetical protein